MTFLTNATLTTSGKDKAIEAFDLNDNTSWEGINGDFLDFHFDKTVNIDKIEIKGNGTFNIDIFSYAVNTYTLFGQVQVKGTKDWETFDVDKFVNITRVRVQAASDKVEIIDVRFVAEACNCCKCPCECEPKPEPTPEPEPEPVPEDKGHVKDGGWGSVDDNPNNWKSVAMKDDKTKFKVVDKDGVNVADLFNTKAGSDAFIAEAIKNYKPDNPTPEPKPEPKPDPKPEPQPSGQIMKINYPECAIPTCKDNDDDKHKAVLPNNDALSNKNKGIKHSEKLPLLAKKDKYGEQYTDIPALCKLAGLDLKVVQGLRGIKNYNFESERTDPYENNNSGGESKRLDMKGTPMAQDEYQLWIYNQSKDSGDETSYKHGGPHSDDIAYQADCMIVQIANDGKSCCTQTEPSHMDDDPYGYGDKFNIINPGLPSLLGKKYTVRFIRLVDLPNEDIINFAAIKIDGDSKFGEWTLIYESHCYGGFDGDRGLKSPYRQWVACSTLNKPSAAGQTVRFDEQPKKNMKKGVDYDKARLTEIVDFS